ncbi:MAG: N-acetyltransferase [bacterium]|nr:N-acetyltransferase [bacterium]
MKESTVVFKDVGIRDVRFGENVTVVRPVNLYDCVIGCDCFIGPFTEIQKDVKVGDRCRIQSHSFICELVEIGSDCFISHGVKFINDPFRVGGPARGRKELWKATRIGDFVSIGTNSTIMPVSICSNVVIGAGSVVTRDILKPGIYGGNPCRFFRAPCENAGKAGNITGGNDG